MSLVDSLLGYRSFSSEPEIRKSIARSKYYDASMESPEDANSLLIFLIFDTSRQHTWLVATPDRLYFILDDVRKPAPRLGRAVHRNELKTLPDGTVAVNTRPKSHRAGLVDIGLHRRGWLYSKRLFSSERPIAVVELRRPCGKRRFVCSEWDATAMDTHGVVGRRDGGGAPGRRGQAARYSAPTPRVLLMSGNSDPAGSSPRPIPALLPLG